MLDKKNNAELSGRSHLLRKIVGSARLITMRKGIMWYLLLPVFLQTHARPEQAVKRTGIDPIPFSHKKIIAPFWIYALFTSVISGSPRPDGFKSLIIRNMSGSWIESPVNARFDFAAWVFLQSRYYDLPILLPCRINGHRVTSFKKIRAPDSHD